MTSHNTYDLGEHDMVIRHVNRAAGLELALAVHRTWNGRAIGGCRIRNYGSLDIAVADALDLSHAMSQKNLLASVPFGGAKMTVNADPSTAKNPEFLRAIGEFVERFGGLYVTAPDSGVGSADLEEIANSTPWVVGFRQPAAKYTSAGVLVALESTAEHLNGTRDLTGVSVLVQGVGNVGSALVQRLSAQGARVLISDVDASRVRTLAEETGAEIVEPGSEHTIEVDIFAPCGLGGVLTEHFAQETKARSICGAANNQLSNGSVSQVLHDRGVSYAPDFVANSGGVIAGAQEIVGFEETVVQESIAEIGRTMGEILRGAEAADLPTTEVAARVARDRLRGLTV